MNIRHFILPFAALLFGFSQHLAAADTSIPTTKPGYNVVLDVTFDEKGVPEDAKVFSSDDPTTDLVLNRVAMALAAEIKQPPKVKEGKPVKFTVRVPFNFPVEGDEGAAADNAPKPTQKGGMSPVYPQNLADAGIVGGAILELIIGADGIVSRVKLLQASHPEFGQSAEEAVKTWTYNPVQKDGVPVESRWRLPIAYSVDGKDVDWKWRVAPRPNLGGSIRYAFHEPKQPATPPLAPATNGADLPVTPPTTPAGK